MKPYDLLVLGAGPAGHRAALQASALGARVAVVERDQVGGTYVQGGAVGLQALRAAILELGARRRERPRLDDLLWRAQQVRDFTRDALQDELRHAGVDLYGGCARFTGPHAVRVTGGAGAWSLSAARFVIAVGSEPRRPESFTFARGSVIDPHELEDVPRLPRSMVIVGAGRTGLEYASLGVALGIDVTVVERRPAILLDHDPEITSALRYQLEGMGARFRLGEVVEAAGPAGAGARVRLRRGETLAADVVVAAVGRTGATHGLQLRAAGLRADLDGHVRVDERFRTAQMHIHAAGDVTGTAGSAAGCQEQGRLCALAAFDTRFRARPQLVPRVAFTIPEAAAVGAHEHELAARGIDYATGRARVRDLVRAQLSGDRAGLLKLLVRRQDRRVVGVHMLGVGAAELIHIGRTVMAGHLAIEHLAHTPFNTPTLAEAYRVAAAEAVAELDAA